MIQFSRLRLNGFKSFVERTELEIGPGLNGVVGPNGCGKSNLVEALRWTMGESSAKRMRGDGMEDVIFNGSGKRSARNIAEVSLLLDNETRSAPAAYNHSDEIEIVRRIERDKGSNYKINGKNVRARDVQMLFADTVTGANSPAIVSQGRVTQIINSKPLERRLILEESAGISGLFARRHEAELKLRAADKNLERIEDVLGSMESRFNALKRQARQAGRYRNISAQIRQLEVMIAYLEWTGLEERSAATQAKFAEAESIVADKLGIVTQLTKTQTTQSQDLPDLRRTEAEIAATLQTQKLALQRLEDEAARQEQMIAETAEQLEQTKLDSQHEQQSLEECVSTLTRLEAEQKEILSQQDGEDDQLEQRQSEKDVLEKKVIALEEQYTALMQSVAETKARRQSLEQQIEQNAQRIDIITQRKRDAAQELEELKSQDNDKDTIDEINSNINTLEEKIKSISEGLSAQRDEQEAAKEAVSSARTDLSEAESRLSEFRAELSTLEHFFEEDSEIEYSPALDQIVADQGFEKALSRALGDALLAALDDDAPSRWRSRDMKAALPALPDGAQSLLPHVKAPKEMQLALSQIGVVQTDDEGDALMNALAPGQSLVSPAGTYWRWDGYCVSAAAADRNALHLEQKNKLKELAKKRPDIEKAAQSAQVKLAEVLEQQTEREERIDSLQSELKTTEQNLNDKRLALSDIRETRARLESEMTRLTDIVALADEDLKTLEEVLKWDQDRLSAYDKTSSEDQQRDSESLKQTLLEAREAYQDTVRAFDQYVQQQNSRRARLQALADERVTLNNRQIRARERLKELSARIESLTEKLAELKSQPQTLDNGKNDLLEKISGIEAKRSAAAEALAACEKEVQDTTRALRDAESTLGEAREARAHAQATLSGIQEQKDHLQDSIQEQFELEPHMLKTHIQIDLEAEAKSLDTLRREKEQLGRERDQMGPVNLRAEDEANELEAELGGMLHERNDLTQAIEELRNGISKINNEARARLSAAFEHVNAHFQRLFVQLYGGGQAHLALVDSDDPLESGLEIFAQPPGKVLQSLSLMSGGEQTLASIALIFAMFLTNPSPICVLDEIDAPLDDANVDRVCDLLEQIAERGETRFLIITHHRLTMARMDRLYGVTMAEQGVSQLVSVDLQQSFEFLEAA